jgi:hypothetical protein
MLPPCSAHPERLFMSLVRNAALLPVIVSESLAEAGPGALPAVVCGGAEGQLSFRTVEQDAVARWRRTALLRARQSDPARTDHTGFEVS